LITEADIVEDEFHSRDSQDQADRHTRKDGDDGFVDGLDLPRLQHIAGEESDDQERDQNEQRPRRENLLLLRLGRLCIDRQRREVRDGPA
jgi:hypothetical protein